MEKIQFGNIDDYISLCSVEDQERLQLLRQLIKEVAPKSIEKISWQMPTFFYHHNLIHFAQHTNHIGIYPGANAVEEFSEELSAYKHAKGSIQFPRNKPLPVELIKRIVAFRVQEEDLMSGNREQE